MQPSTTTFDSFSSVTVPETWLRLTQLQFITVPVPGTHTANGTCGGLAATMMEFKSISSKPLSWAETLIALLLVMSVELQPGLVLPLSSPLRLHIP